MSYPIFCGETYTLKEILEIVDEEDSCNLACYLQTFFHHTGIHNETTKDPDRKYAKQTTDEDLKWLKNFKDKLNENKQKA